MSIYIVYKATNRVNGKNYIGYTNNLEQRKRRHLSSSNNKNDKGYFSHFHCAIRLYGWKNKTINEKYTRKKYS